jgi:hypothetical protein
LVFVLMPRLWTVSRRHGYVTPADFVGGRYRSQTLALVVALTGLLATMPYIALQLVGIQAVLGAMGINGDWPLILAFAILAAYTYQSGLRAPAAIAVVTTSRTTSRRRRSRSAPPRSRSGAKRAGQPPLGVSVRPLRKTSIPPIRPSH